VINNKKEATMDLSRIQELAGINTRTELDEIVSKDDLLNLDLDEITKRLQHCKKALAIANTLPDAADRKKWKGAALANLNRVRAALSSLSAALQKEIS
jgi:hypothetical protein